MFLIWFILSARLLNIILFFCFFSLNKIVTLTACSLIRSKPLTSSYWALWQILKLKRFRFFSEKFPFFPACFRNHSGVRPEKSRNFSGKKRNLLSFQVRKKFARQRAGNFILKIMGLFFREKVKKKIEFFYAQVDS